MMGVFDTAKREKDNVTFRLDELVLKKLKEEAKQKEVSLNILANQILKSHIDWHVNAAKAGFIPIQKQLLTRLLKKYSEDEISDITDEVATDTIKDISLLLRQEYSIVSALDVIETKLKMSDFPYTHTIHDSEHKYVIQHDLGIKWSRYLSQSFRFLFEEFNLPNFSFDITENTVSFRIEIQ